MIKLSGSYKTRQGFTVPIQFDSITDMVHRLHYLLEDERKTRELAWTNTGDVRFNYQQEIKEIQEIITRNFLK